MIDLTKLKKCVEIRILRYVKMPYSLEYLTTPKKNESVVLNKVELTKEILFLNYFFGYIQK